MVGGNVVVVKAIGAIRRACSLHHQTPDHGRSLFIMCVMYDRRSAYHSEL